MNCHSSRLSRSSLVTFLLSVFCFLPSLHAQEDMRGTEFWLTFGKNYELVTCTNLELQIRIAAGDQPATGTIYFTHTGMSVPFTVAAHRVTSYRFTDAEKEAVYNIVSGVTDKSIHITSSAPVSVYAFSQSLGNTDATNVLPIPVLGNNYYHISYTVPSNSSKYLDAYAVVATQNDTKVWHADESVPVTLNKGQVYYRTFKVDTTGSHITSNKPIAFFAVHQACQIPDTTDYMDNLFCQLAPVHLWGKTFFVPHSHLEKDIVRVIASEDNTQITQLGGTVLSGGFKCNTGQFLEIMVPESSNGCYITADKAVGVCAYLASNSYSMLFYESDPAQTWLPAIEQTVTSAVIAPFIPLNSTALKKHYALITTPTVSRNDTRVAIGNGQAQPLSGGVWKDNSDAKMSFYSMPLTDPSSAYFYTNPAGLLIMAYGVGANESYYYVAASSTRNLKTPFYVNDIHYQDLTSDVICAQPLQFRAEIAGKMSTLPGHLKWYINDYEESAARDQLTWSKTLPEGVYRIKMTVLATDNITIYTSEAVITAGLTPVLANDYKNIEFCAGEICSLISIRGTNVNDTVSTWEVTDGNGTAIGMYSDRGTEFIPAFTTVNNSSDPLTVTILLTPKTKYGCTGEPKMFTITVYPLMPVDVDLGNDTIICHSNQLQLNAEHPNATSYLWQDNSDKPAYTATKSGNYWVTVRNRCSQASDTIHITFLTLNVNLGSDLAYCEDEVIYRVLDVTAPNATSYVWQDGSALPTYIIEQTGIYSVTVSNVCMSVSDSVTVRTKDCSILNIWIPNAFTPNEDGLNDIFKPEINDVEYLREYEMSIYDRWGGLLFNTQDSQIGWNGKNRKGKECSKGIYAGVIRCKDHEGREFIKQFSITLLR